MKICSISNFYFFLETESNLIAPSFKIINLKSIAILILFNFNARLFFIKSVGKISIIIGELFLDVSMQNDVPLLYASLQNFILSFKKVGTSATKTSKT